MLRALAIATAVLALLPAGEAYAQGTREQRREARRIARQGAQQYDLGHFEEALAQYERAYEVYSAPQLLFNIGQCHRELGHHERVVYFFERFLGEVPDAPNRRLVTELLEESRAILERQRANRVQRNEEAEAARQALEEERQRRESLAEERERLAAERDEALRRAAESGEVEPGPEIYEEWWFWTIIGVVVAASVAIPLGVVYGQPEPQPPSGSLGTVTW